MVRLYPEWFANIDSAQTRRAYKNAIREFMAFIGIAGADEFRDVTRAHVIAWRTDLERYCQLNAMAAAKPAVLNQSDTGNL